MTQIERYECLIVCEPFRFGLAFDVGQMLQIDNAQWNRQRWCNQLHRPSINSRKGSSQRFVPPHDFIQAPLESADVEPAAEGRRAGNVINRCARRKLIEEPEPLL